MSKLRCIAIAPKFTEDASMIQEYRLRYDSLANLVPPHITLMFPFSSGILSEVLKRHLIDSCKDIGQFKISTGQAGVLPDNVIALPILDGACELKKLHDSLYKGAFSDFLNVDLPYHPHITIGRFANLHATEQGLEEAKMMPCLQGWVSEVYCEEIAPDNSSIVESVVRLTEANL